MIGIKPARPPMSDIAALLRRGSHLQANKALADWPNLRFAVGTFDSWQQLRNALYDLRLSGLVLDSFNCLAVRRVFAGKLVIARSQEPVAIEELAFPDNGELLGCTSGPLADCLADRLGSGARSLEDALAFWLLPRHAGHFQRVVEDGKILLWVRLADADDERRACQCLFATSSNAVGVHDLLAPPRPREAP